MTRWEYAWVYLRGAGPPEEWGVTFSHSSDQPQPADFALLLRWLGDDGWELAAATAHYAAATQFVFKRPRP